MGAVNNLVVLALVGFAAAWENLPNIPANRRAEYYLLHDDGAYKFGYDTGSGASHMAQADNANEVRGSYAYESPEGPVTLVYTAGRGGFVPSLQSGSSSVSVQAAKSSSQHGAAATHYSASSTSQATSGADYDENADASYAFNINTDEYKRDEASDAKGNVRGRYSYSGKDGNNVAVSYSAGAGKGFVIESHEGLNPAASPVATYSAPAPITPTFNSFAVSKAPIAKPYSGPLANIFSTGPNLDGSYAFSYQTPEIEREESSDASGLVKGRYSFVAGDGVRRTVDYNAGALLGFVPQGDGIAPPLPAAPVAYVAPVATAYTGSAISSSSHSFASSQKDDLANTGDASYTFAYQADDHERKESSDPSGNVQGVYSYTAPDGNSRTVKYTAGANKGFVVEQSQAAVTSYKAPARLATNTVSAQQYSTANKQNAAFNSAASTGNTDASYSFSYQADNHARQESSDAQGNVRGSYSFKADDGVSRQVDYVAGANKGFIAKGAHLPTPVVAPAASVAVKSTVNTVSYIPPAPIKTVSYIPPAPVATKAVISSAPADASYSFNYNAGDSSRQESADPSGFVRGHFSFVADDGVSRSVQYEAGAGKGFVAQGSHLPTAPVVATKTSSSGSSWSAKTAAPVAAASWSKAPVSTYSAAAEKKGDSSYSYSYQTDSSSKQESSDANGNVVGTFTYVGGDGQSRTLNYVAGSESGFLASGAHLPVAPSADSGVAVAKSGSSSGSWNSGASATSGSWNAGTATSTGSWNSGAATGSSWSSKTVSTPSSSTSNFVLHKYLPPDSAHKFGYILDTRV